MVLVEGLSDRAALDTLARRLGRDLESERVSFVSMGGSSAVGEVIDRCEFYMELDVPSPRRQIAVDLESAAAASDATATERGRQLWPCKQLELLPGQFRAGCR